MTFPRRPPCTRHSCPPARRHRLVQQESDQPGRRNANRHVLQPDTDRTFRDRPGRVDSADGESRQIRWLGRGRDQPDTVDGWLFDLGPFTHPHGTRDGGRSWSRGGDGALRRPRGGGDNRGPSSRHVPAVGKNHRGQRRTRRCQSYGGRGHRERPDCRQRRLRSLRSFRRGWPCAYSGGPRQLSR